MGEKTFPFPDADASLQLMEAETLFYAVHNCSITKPPKHICMATSGLEEQIQFQEEQIPTFVRTRGGENKRLGSEEQMGHTPSGTAPTWQMKAKRIVRVSAGEWATRCVGGFYPVSLIRQRSRLEAFPSSVRVHLTRPPPTHFYVFCFFVPREPFSLSVCVSEQRRPALRAPPGS